MKSLHLSSAYAFCYYFLAAPLRLLVSVPLVNSDDCRTDEYLTDPNSKCSQPSLSTLTCQNNVHRSYKGENITDPINHPEQYDPLASPESQGIQGLVSAEQLPTDPAYFDAWNCGVNCYDKLKGPRGNPMLWKPATDDGKGAVLYVHGGSWWYGSPLTNGYPAFAARIAREWKMPVLSIDYQLVAKANTEGIHAEGILLSAAKSLRYLGDKFQGRKFVIAGDSSGGGTALSAVMAQAYRSDDFVTSSGGYSFSAAVLYSPWINLLSNSPTYYSQNFCEIPYDDGTALNGDVSFYENGDNAVPSSAKNARDYVGPNLSLKDPIFNPLFFQPDQLQATGGLPPIQIHTGTSELLQADCSMFAEKVCSGSRPQSNIANLAECNLYDGMFHDFSMYSKGCSSGEELVLANSSMRRSKDFVESVLGTSSTTQSFTCGAKMHYEYPRGWDSVEYFSQPRKNPSVPTSSTNDSSSSSNEKVLTEDSSAIGRSVFSGLAMTAALSVVYVW